MGSIDLAIRFTEEKYSTKSDVIKELKTSLVDNIWANILEYRKGLFRTTNIFGIDNREFNICNCQSLISKNTNLEMKLLRVMKETSTYSVNEYNSLELSCFINCLKPLARNHKLDDSDSSIRMIARKEIRSNDEEVLLLSRYLTCLNKIKQEYANPLTLETILSFYKTLTNDELANFRTIDSEDRNNRVLIDRIYTAAPKELIEPLMEQLVTFINETKFDPLITASVAYFYINMVKPFDKHTEEVSLLVAKYIVCHESMGAEGTIVPLENILDASNDEVGKMFNDTQRYADLTYFILFVLQYTDGICDYLLDFLAKNKMNVLKEEFYQGDEEVKEEVVVQQPREVIKETVKEVPVEEVVVKSIVKEQLAVNFAPTEISDREAARLANHLLELDPSLKKNEAFFYAKHCTLGKKYTIQQFKKSIGCAYETARTSMDHLAELGYYRKEAIKNKFVYSPIAR